MRITNELLMLGYQGESNVREITYEVDDDLLDGSLFINIDCPVGKYKLPIDTVKSGVFVVPGFLASQKGVFRAQLELFGTDNRVYRSKIINFTINESIYADDTLESYFPLQEKSITLASGTEDVLPDEGFYGLGKVTVNVENAVFVTYQELVELRNTNRLESGLTYRIVDYVTTTSDPETRSAEHPFDLVVIATSENTIGYNAYAVKKDDDEYFANSDLTKWQIWYDIENDTTKYSWADTTNGKGVIYRMIDEFNNDLPYDFKNIQFKRYKITAATNTCNSGMVGKYLGFHNSYQNDVPYGLTQDLNDFVYRFTFDCYANNEDCSLYYRLVPTASSTYGCFANNVTMLPYYIDNPHYRERLGLNNIVMTALHTNSIDFAEECHHNTLYCDSPTSGYLDIGINKYSKLFRRNVIIGNQNHNKIGDCFQDNTIGNSSNIDGNFSWNNISGDHAQNNCIGNYFKSNDISKNFSDNIISANFIDNTIQGSFSRNNISESFQQNTVESYFTQNTITGAIHTTYFATTTQGNTISANVERCNILTAMYYSTIAIYLRYANINQLFFYSTLRGNGEFQILNINSANQHLVLVGSDTFGTKYKNISVGSFTTSSDQDVVVDLRPLESIMTTTSNKYIRSALDGSGNMVVFLDYETTDGDTLVKTTYKYNNGTWTEVYNGLTYITESEVEDIYDEVYGD